MINPIKSNSTAYHHMTKEKEALSNKSHITHNQRSDTLEIGRFEHIDNVTYSRPAPNRVDVKEVDKLWEATEKATQHLRDLVEKLILNQGKATSLSEDDSITIDSKTRAEAKKAISEDGEWGVKAVSSRIVAFAKAISGGDKSKFEEIKSAIDAGFNEAERILGGALPEISQKTYDEVMSQLNQWANE